jgi:hypothetical protein
MFCLAEKVHFLGSEEGQKQEFAKPNKKEIKKIEEKVEMADNEVDDIDDIPF